ncbi:hypothetical protein [Winogradskyella damuponensis]|uniref:DUF4382 domain-containing protein n=1 Tax=Winogradskyella damuponensis TaxID=943939 RepID=A0ABP8CWN1_9FLAO
MKHIKRFTFAILVILSVSCSSDDDNSGSQNENNITVGASVYEMKTAIVEPASIGHYVYLSVSNKTEAEITAAINGTTINNVDLFTARINALDLTPNRTYNLSEISSLEFIVDGDFIGADFENGVSQFYLGDGTSDLRVVDGSITVTDYAVEAISLSFSFTRADGKDITGSFEGAFLYLTSDDE